MSAHDALAGSPLGGLLSSLAQAEAAGDEAAAFYEELRDGFAKDMLEQFRTGTVVLVKPSAAQGSDPLNAFDGVDLRTPRNAFVTGFPMAECDGQKVIASDLRVLIDGADFTDANRPHGSDRIEVDSVQHEIVSLKKIPAAGPTVLYIVQARSAAAGGAG